MRARLLFSLSLSLSLSPGTAWAVDRFDFLITTNKSSGYPGRRLTLDRDVVNPLDLGDDEPCHNTTLPNPTVNMSWTTVGDSIGISKNRVLDATYPYVYAAVTDTNGNNGCSAGAPGWWCVGAAYYDVSDTDASPSITWTWSDVYQSTSLVASDVAAVRSSTLDAVVLLNKMSSGNILQYQLAGVANDDYWPVDHASRVEWLGTDYFVSSETETINGTAAGSLVLGKRLDGTFLWDGQVETIAGGYSKPEGIDVKPLNNANRGSCDLDADYLVYAADYHNSRLYLYVVDLDAGGSGDMLYPQLVSGSTDNYITLNVDNDGDTSSFTGSCNPSTVRYHDTDKNAYVLCQTRATIIRITTSSDPCAPQWDAGQVDEAKLKMYSGNNDPPSCSYDPPLTDCIGCSPHTIEYDKFIRPYGDEWLFVGLSGVGEILAVDKDNLATQRTIYRSGNFAPYDFVIAPSCNPNSQTCVYP